jgi:inner membrane protein
LPDVLEFRPSGSSKMCSLITHPVVPVAISSLFPRQSLSPAVVIAGAICSVVPDFDVIGFSLGIRYGDMLGHRGLTHSILFAAVLGALLTFRLAEHNARARLLVFIFLVSSTLSHAILDSLTNGGLGVAFFAPFQNERYFFSWRPVQVSPIGLKNFFADGGLHVLRTELLWIWLPAAIIYAFGYLIKLPRQR